MFKDLSIKRRMYILVLIPVILGLIFIVSFATYELDKTADGLTKESVTNLAKANSSEIANDLTETLPTKVGRFYNGLKVLLKLKLSKRWLAKAN